MKMVSAAKFKKAHDNIIHIRPYVDRLAEMILNLTPSLDEKVSSDWAVERDVKRILIISIASNRGLCAAFNTNVVNRTEKLIKKEFNEYHRSNAIDVIAIGKQVEKPLRKHGFNVVGELNDIFTNTTLNAVNEISDGFMKDFLTGKYDKIILVYNEFVSAAVQNVKAEQFLPMQMPDSYNFV